MTQKEIGRYEIIKDLINKKINGTDASKLMNLTIRQVANIKANVKKHGAKGIVHGNRGRESNRKIPDKNINEIKRIVEKEYNDFKPTFASEKLEERNGIKISSEKLRQLMIEWNLWKPRKRKVNNGYRAWRKRKECYGEMQQYDGSYHEWFENRAPECCLLTSIDDATSKITYAKFDSGEGVVATFNFWKEYLRENGMPINIYLDKFSTYKINHPSAKDNSELITQFQRATKSIGIKLITANSPEAKGRIERLFRTLQDRLVKELRLNNISDIEEANKFLKEVFIPEFNKKFSVVPDKNINLHRELTGISDEQLEKIFSIHDYRLVNNDFTIRFKNKYYQLEKEQPLLVRKKERVLIETRTSEEVFISIRDKYLNFFVLPEKPKKIADLKIPALTRNTSSYKPPANHPWRRFSIKPIDKKMKVA